MKLNALNPLIQKLYSMNVLKKAVTVDRETNEKKPSQNRPSRTVFFLAKIIGSGFFIGYVPVAQGTFGSLWGPALYMLIPDTWIVDFFPEVSLVLMGMIVLLYFTGVWSAGVCEVFWGRDPGRVVIDEIAGMFVTLVFIPLTLTSVWLGFFLFRIFDVIKPPPARRAERLPGGWGVMSDDLIAGIYANIILRIIVYLF